MDLDLNDKVAIVTGSSRGLGLASARALAAEGCRVTLCARTADRLEEAAREVASVAGGRPRVLTVVADVTQTDGIAQVIEETVTTFGGIDILVNNVAAAGGSTLLDTADTDWE